VISIRKKYTIWKAALVFFSLLVIFSGCDKELVEAEESKILKKLSTQDLELIQANNNLSLDLLKAEFELNQNKNFLFSPISVGMALGMIYNGVGESEKYKIQKISGLESLAEKEINKSYNEFLSFLQLSNQQSDLFCANSLWFSYDLDINENYRTKVMAYYDAEINEINFGKKTSLQYINNWGSMKTGGNFDQISKLTPSASYSIYLINAFGMNTSWENSRFFYKTRNFTGLHGESGEVQTINLDQASIWASDNASFDFVEIPLKGQKFLFSIINPAEGTTLENLIENYTFNELIGQIGATNEEKANISIPDMSFTVENPLKSTLVNLGLQNIFQTSLDLSPSFLNKNPGISEINQIARFHVKGQLNMGNEKDFTNPELRLISLDKPFMYFVRDKYTRSVIFAGYYTNPEK
jgi:serine protease inhibitor